MFIAVIPWRIRPEPDALDAFRDHWNRRNRIKDRAELIGEFLSEALPAKDYPYITWHLDPESVRDSKSYVTVGLWSDPESFAREVAQYFNDECADACVSKIQTAARRFHTGGATRRIGSLANKRLIRSAVSRWGCQATELSCGASSYDRRLEIWKPHIQRGQPITASAANRLMARAHRDN